MRRIYWDSNVFAYLLEGSPEFGPRVGAIWENLKRRGDVICTAVFTLGELLVLPRRHKDEVGAAHIRTALRPPRVELLPFDAETADYFADLRASYPLTSPDAIHLATAIHTRANVFLTNDRRLCRLRGPGIPLIAPLDADLY